MKALILKSTTEPPTVDTIPTPQPTLGSAVVKVEIANIISYMRDIYNGKRRYPFPMPLVPGISAVGRVAAVGPDASRLEVGDLVYIDCTIRSRDDPTHVFLAGIYDGDSAGSKKLMKDVWRDWTYAEYCRAPLENLTRIDEEKLLGTGGLGYSIAELSYVSALMVPYGGLRTINLQAGQTVVVAPATGPFGGAAVVVAQAMGARVIAMGRRKEALEALKSRVAHPDRLETVQITGDVQAEIVAIKHAAGGEVDAFFDIGPPAADKSSHIASCILSLRHGGKVALMGGYLGDIAIPARPIMHKNLSIHGKWMYERSDMDDMFKLIETGVLKLPTVVKGEYALEEWEEAWDRAAECIGLGEQVVIKP